MSAAAIWPKKADISGYLAPLAPRSSRCVPHSEVMKQCQSCGMPLQTKEAGDCRGTEADGARSDQWCSLCYQDGVFIDPDCTVEQMKVIVDSVLRERGNNRVFRWMATSQIPRLARWKSTP